MKLLVFCTVLSICAMSNVSAQFNPFAFISSLIQGQVNSTTAFIAQVQSNIEKSLVPIFANINSTINNATMNIAFLAYKINQCTANESDPGLTNEVLGNLTECYGTGAAGGFGIIHNFTTQIFEPSKNFLLGIPSEIQKCRENNNDTQQANACINALTSRSFQQTLNFTALAAKNGLQALVVGASIPINLQVCLVTRTTGVAIRLGQIGGNVTNCVFKNSQSSQS